MIDTHLFTSFTKRFLPLVSPGPCQTSGVAFCVYVYIYGRKVLTCAMFLWKDPFQILWIPLDGCFYLPLFVFVLLLLRICVYVVIKKVTNKLIRA